MVARLRARTTARREAQTAFRYWLNWFVMTSVAILCFIAFTGYQDPTSTLLVETRELGSLDEDYLKQQIEGKPEEKVNAEEQSPDDKKEGIAKALSLEEITKDHPPEEVYFLDNSNLAHHDGFSASWLQTREDFLTMPWKDIQSCEHTAFRAYDLKRKDKYRMTLDWMQFSVEHMSKWWKILEWDSNPVAYQAVLAKFQGYLNGAGQFPEHARIFKNTIAVIAFQSYNSQEKPEESKYLTSLSLAVTVESLRRAGFGRVVTSVLVPDDIPYVDNAYHLIAEQLDSKSSSQTEITKLGHMEVGYAIASKAYTKTSFLIKNMPRGTVMTLRDAFLHSMEPEAERTPDMKQNMTAWLGDTQDPSYWQYVYLTEPDTLLTFRPSSLPAIKAEIDKGNVVLPHRFQPVPHESDVRGMNNTDLFLHEEEFPEVIDLDPIRNHDACCDENKGKGFKPGHPPFYEWCGARKFWYNCGFYKENRKQEDKHRRIKPYKLMRVKGGTEVTTIAGSEHARRCHPKKKGVCRPDDVQDAGSFVKSFDEEKRKYVESMLHTITK